MRSLTDNLMILILTQRAQSKLLPFFSDDEAPGGKYADIKGIVGTWPEDGPVGIPCLFCACKGGLGWFGFWFVFVKYLGSIKGLFSFPDFPVLVERMCGEVFSFSSVIVGVL